MRRAFSIAQRILVFRSSIDALTPGIHKMEPVAELAGKKLVNERTMKKIKEAESQRPPQARGVEEA
jgi:predicted nucleotide-binding protein (sugar kinase/HSP70/actin superfamily)